ncbi:MAG TPA: DedA family protein [Candidatus Nanoarchaeia archaeon]|nr:DedA family protein [Candidatus Nanoarchaeia archaeon]
MLNPFTIIDFIMNIDSYLGGFILKYGLFVYIILFLIIFIETGLVIMPFLPGDSLLFAAGAFAAIGSLNLFLIFVLVSSAAIFGDALNYLLGYKIGRKIFQKEDSWIFKKKYLAATENFYEKHGSKTIFLARFVPIIRTFAPFVAGMGRMKYSKFLAYNISGGFIWAFLFIFTGYFFGNIPFVKENFSVVILVIIFISILPLIVKGFLNYKKNRKMKRLIKEFK